MKLMLRSIVSALALIASFAPASSVWATPASCYDPHNEVNLRPGDTHTMNTSWYGPGLQGNPMANGDTFDMKDPTITAHKVLPLGTKLQIRNPLTNVVRIATVTDDGPHPKGRDLDASRALAMELGFIQAGHLPLEVTILEFGNNECRDDGEGLR